MSKFSPSKIVRTITAAVATGSIVLGATLLKTRHPKTVQDSVSQLILGSTASSNFPTTKPSQDNSGRSESKDGPIQNLAMSNVDRNKYLQKLLDSIGDGVDPEENLVKIGDLGAAGEGAVDTLIRYAPNAEKQWPVYVALARIGKPADKIASFLMNEIEQGKEHNEETPLAFASLVMLGPKAKSVGIRVQAIYDVAIANYQIAHRQMRADHDGITDGENRDMTSITSYDSAFALIVVDPNNPSAPSAVSRIVVGDPRANWQNGESAFGNLLMSNEDARDKPDYYYGLGVCNALSIIVSNPQLSQQLASSLVSGAKGIQLFAYLRKREESNLWCVLAVTLHFRRWVLVARHFHTVLRHRPIEKPGENFANTDSPFSVRVHGSQPALK